MSRLELHQQYTLSDGTPVPSVTAIIGGNCGWSTDSLMGWAAFEARRGQDYKEIRDRAGRIGTITHALIEQELGGENTINLDEYAPLEVQAAEIAFSAFQDFSRLYTLEAEELEVGMVDEHLAYGGTIDFAGTINGLPCIIDFKTSSRIYPTHRLQLAAYQNLWAVNRNERRVGYLLHLDKKTGTFTLQSGDDLEDEWMAFCLFLQANEIKQILQA